MRKEKELLKRLIFLVLIVIIIGLPSKASYAESIQYTNNVIPVMTNYTLPSGVVSASSVYDDSAAWRAFDHNTTTSFNGWVTANNNTNGWLEYDFPDAKCITKYTLVTRVADSNQSHTLQQMPKDWTFEAYNEITGKWVTLDTRQNVTDWSYKLKKEFSFSNTLSYKKYRINITANCGFSSYTALGELEMMETVSAPTNLTATPGDRSVQLQWNPVTGAEKYNIKRLEADGTYKTFATVENGSSLTYTDINLSNGTTYYYVVSAVVEGIESSDSNIVSATPQATANATLSITFDNGLMKEYNLTGAEINDFLTWYDNRSNGVGLAYYVFTVKGTVSPYASIKNYIPFNKILYFDVKSYN